MKLARGLAAVTAAALTTVGLTACAPEGPTRDQVLSIVREAVEAVPGIEGALVSTYSAGLAGPGLTLKIYVADAGRLTELVDGALSAAWSTSPIDPEGIAIQAFEGELPEGARFGDPSGLGLDLTAVTDDLGFGGAEAGTGVDSSGALLRVASHRLSERYGPRAEDGDD